MAQTLPARTRENKKGKSRGPKLAVRRRLTVIRCLSDGFFDYSGKGTNSFDVLTGDQELEDRTANYRPEIGQSQHAKSVSYIIIKLITWVTSLELWQRWNSLDADIKILPINSFKVDLRKCFQSSEIIKRLSQSTSHLSLLW